MPINAVGAAQELAGTVVPLSDRFQSSLANAYVAAGSELSAIRAASNDPEVASDPARLIALQLRTEHYTKQMIVTAGLTNAAVKAVETLVKS